MKEVQVLDNSPGTVQEKAVAFSDKSYGFLD